MFDWIDTVVIPPGLFLGIGLIALAFALVRVLTPKP